MAKRKTNKKSEQKGILAKWFPMIRSREAVFREIEERTDLKRIFDSWTLEHQEDFLDFCSGMKGCKVLYDGFFKEIFNAEYAPERLETLLSLILNRKVRIKQVLPNDAVRLGEESSLLYTDIIVELEDGSLSNIEMQRIGYKFPGQRSACYSADHLLRQYKRVRGQRGKKFTYEDIKQVYTIVFFEKSWKEFQSYPENWLHRFKQRSNTGMEMELLQEYYFIPLDIYKKSMENKTISNDLEAWMAFLSFDEPERIVELITRYPKFQAMYQDIYEMCMNTERTMEMYSKELQELDRNTVRYMIDELQEDLEQMQAEKKRLEEETKQMEAEKAQAEAEKAQAEAEKAQAETEKAQAEAENRLLRQKLEEAGISLKDFL